MRLHFDVSVTLDAQVRQIMTALKPDAVPRVFPRTVLALERLAVHGQTRWAERALRVPGTPGRPLQLGPMVQLKRTELAASIRVSPVQLRDRQIQAEVWSVDPQAALVESGTPGGEPMDLHKVLPFAPKARRTHPQKNKPQHLYLRIPFRHATTAEFSAPGTQFRGAALRPGHGALTPGILAAMAPKPRYLRTRYLGPVPSDTQPGRRVRRFLYTPAQPAQLTLREIQTISARARTHTISNEYAKLLVGLMHVGRRGHGHYLTIRTLSQSNPEGWRVPAYPPQRIAHAVAEELWEAAQRGYFDEAIRADLEAGRTRAGG